jgi:hypothetical protein
MFGINKYGHVVVVLLFTKATNPALVEYEGKILLKLHAELCSSSTVCAIWFCCSCPENWILDSVIWGGALLSFRNHREQSIFFFT